MALFTAVDPSLEIKELQTKIRVMENDKKAYSEESELMLQRQAKMIDKLKDENRQLCKQMVMASKKKP